MDSGHMHKFGFSEAISLLVRCEDQKEIDYYSSKLSAVAEAEQCGWLKDKYGLSWQISPVAMEEMLQGDQEKVDRVMEAFMKMKRVDLAALKKAYEGE
jgi:predicted 3-demethylubiquinone-9 3-methyltransferase (glyoxalase superfamily)